MSGTPTPDEPNAHQDEQPDTKLSPQLLIWAIRFLTIAYLATVMYNLLSEDEIRLHLLHGTVRLLQSLARLFGGWALLVENHYNEYVGTLH